MQLTLLHAKPSCTACDLHSSAKNVGIPSRHLPTSLPPDPANPVVIVIGMNPGTQEDRAGECWIGPSGQLLSGPYLTGSGINSLATVYLCNVARCVSPGGKPKPAHYRTCFSHTLADIQTILEHHIPATARAILCAGADPVTHLSRTWSKRALSQQEAFRTQGIAIPTLSRTHFFATYHPAAVLREPGLIHPVADHMALLRNFLTGELARPSAPLIREPFYPVTEANLNNAAFRQGTLR